MFRASSALRRSKKKTEHFKMPGGAAQPQFWAKFGPVVSMSIVRSHKYISTGIQGRKHTRTDANTLFAIPHINTHMRALTHSGYDEKKIGGSVFSRMSSLSAASAACSMLTANCKLQLSSCVLHCLTTDLKESTA